MGHKITCYTLFDITNTGVLNRAKPGEEQDHDAWLLARNQQCNFDTILQAISLRSQPEIVSAPKQILLAPIDEWFDGTRFGFIYEKLSDMNIIPCWMFTFEIQHSSVFEDGISSLGALYADCDGVPMIKCGTDWPEISNFLDTTPELRNIFFMRVTDET